MYREQELIRKIMELFPTPDGVRLGIGDDCAVLDRERFDLVTTDSLVEGVHFRRDWSEPEDIGWKILARCISDIAAMGGKPGVFFLNLVLGPGDDRAFVDGLLAGMKAASVELGGASDGVGQGVRVSTAGGDVSATRGPTVIAMMLLGSSPASGPVLRSGALPGDKIVLLGPTGLSGAAVDLLSGRFAAAGVAGEAERYPALVGAHRRPRPRALAGALLGERAIPSAMIDVSDGLARDLMHILARSAVGARVELEKLPKHEELARLEAETGADVLQYMLAGGDDYELLMTVAPENMVELLTLAGAQGWTVYEIGEVLDEVQGLQFVDGQGVVRDLQSAGYQHFEAS